MEEGEKRERKLWGKGASERRGGSDGETEPEEDMKERGNKGGGKER